MENRDPISEQKALARQRLRVVRDEIGIAQHASHSSAIQRNLFQLEEISAAKTVFCFISIGKEVATHEVINQLQSMGKSILVPKILPGEPMRAVLFTGWENLEPGVLGIPAPVTSAAFTGYVDLVITPGLGFTPTGTRIGYGRGYYDRWFADHEHGLRVGVAFECQLQESIPAEMSDVVIHLLITERRVLTTAQPRP